jgi:uncharacterized protein (TIGR02646 family)
MIRLNRVRTEAAIPAVFRGDKRLDQALKLLVAAGVEREFESGYWKKAKNQLKVESGGKCAYCEAPTALVAHGDVEHFRPKSRYWWLAYCYDNYLFACQLCNQSFKGNEFPLADETLRMTDPVLAAGATAEQKRELVRLFAPDPFDASAGQPWSQFETALKSEGAYLLNPYVDDPEEYFAWEPDTNLKEVAIRPAKVAYEPFCNAAIRYYGLNRQELLVERGKTYRKLALFRAAYENVNVDTALRSDNGDMLREMMGGDSAFAAMCRYFVRKVWNVQL